MQSRANGPAALPPYAMLCVAAGYHAQYATAALLTVLYAWLFGSPFLAFVVWALSARWIAVKVGELVTVHWRPVSALYAACVIQAYMRDWRIGTAMLMVLAALGTLTILTERQWRRSDEAWDDQK